MLLSSSCQTPLPTFDSLPQVVTGEQEGQSVFPLSTSTHSVPKQTIFDSTRCPQTPFSGGEPFSCDPLETWAQSPSGYPSKMEDPWTPYMGNDIMTTENDSSNVHVKKEGLHMADSVSLPPHFMQCRNVFEARRDVFNSDFTTLSQPDKLWDRKSNPSMGLSSRSNFDYGTSSAKPTFCARAKDPLLRLGAVTQGLPTFYSNSSTHPNTPCAMIGSSPSFDDSKMGTFTSPELMYPLTLGSSHSSRRGSPIASDYSHDMHQGGQGLDASYGQISITSTSSPMLPTLPSTSTYSLPYSLNHPHDESTFGRYQNWGQQYDQYHQELHDSHNLGQSSMLNIPMQGGQKDLPDLIPSYMLSQPSHHVLDGLSPLSIQSGAVDLHPYQESFSGTWSPTVRDGRGVELTRAQRREQDQYLVHAKLSGMTYREIRLRGNFSEAESTLRGRFRTLTKRKEARVRKPTWHANDIRLLKEAVRILCDRSTTTLGKIPWKKVAEYIYANGGSYLFGNSTCRKKWVETGGSMLA
ncbi:hypothetical protein BROUX41_004216 [Berkeleyomyces rouxiae]|uniref:uncharacterized protein n=1 Tax=Berkeleyomyces rouxiae TaxID=2035830 RepID=UPI003B80392E